MRPNFFANTPDILHEYLQTRRTAGVRGAADPRGDAVGQLRHLQRLRALRERAGPAGLGGVPRLGEVPDQAARLEPARQPQRADRAGQRDPPRSTRRCSRTTRSRSTRPTTTRCSGSARADPRRATAVFVVANTDPHWMQHGRVAGADLGARHRRPTRPTSSRTCSTARATRGAGEWNYVQARSRRAGGAHLRASRHDVVMTCR